MEKKKLTDDKIFGLVSSVKNTPYSLDLAIDVSELVGNLRNKIEEDFKEIDKIKEKLTGVEAAARVLEDLDIIEKDLRAAATSVNALYNYIKPKK